MSDTQSEARDIRDSAYSQGFITGMMFCAATIELYTGSWRLALGLFAFTAWALYRDISNGATRR